MPNVQITHQLLRQCFSNMINHLSRTTPFHLLQDFLGSFDNMKREILQQMINSNVDNITWNQECLGLDIGGLGYQDTHRISHCTYISGIFQNSDSLTVLNPNIFVSDVTTIEAFRIHYG